MDTATVAVKTPRAWEYTTYSKADATTWPPENHLILMRVRMGSGTHVYLTGYMRYSEDLQDYTFWQQQIVDGRVRITELLTQPVEWQRVYSPLGTPAV